MADLPAATLDAIAAGALEGLVAAGMGTGGDDGTTNGDPARKKTMLSAVREQIKGIKVKTKDKFLGRGKGKNAAGAKSTDDTNDDNAEAEDKDI